jgi:hypothetical protein
MPGMEHQRHDDAPLVGEKLGRVSFPTSCAAGSQAPVERGIALLHSFGYAEAQTQFEAVAEDDPACAIAPWGVAMSQFVSYGASPTKRLSRLVPSRWLKPAIWQRRRR